MRFLTFALCSAGLLMSLGQTPAKAQGLDLTTAQKRGLEGRL